ncbi:TIGR03086 family metal-binding protein [Nocardiopsis sp. Huas11]|uniref:TIGR03086 family metal-binding protein n=1 Tax=Nocardiopsis sp. Huas11 TaxID=2183912 RepID=UPI000EAC9C92|nr:TIGR03086 family metal-binding protein [Nocardiopsis sp. Huas11]
MSESTTDPATAADPAHTDPREALTGAVALVGEVIARTRPDQSDLATPCPDYGVRDLCRHLVSVGRRVAVLGGGGDFHSVPHFAEDVADGQWSAAWDAAAGDITTVWSDPAVLGREIALPWGPVPGAVAAVNHTTEFVLHAWDLAVATGQDPEWDPAVLAGPLAAMHRAVPAEPRTAPVPFGPVVPVPDDAPGIDRLVAWYGRRPR